MPQPLTDLQAVAEIVATYCKKKIDIIVPWAKETEKDGLFQKFFHGLPKNIVPDGKEKKGDYFGYVRGSSSFRSVVSRFGNALYDLLPHLDLSKSRLSMVNRAEYECARMQLYMEVLSLLYARKAAVPIARSLFNKAEKFRLSKYSVYGAEWLRKHASENGETAEFEKLCTKWTNWSGQYQAEGKAKQYLEEITVHFVKSSAQQPELTEKAFKYASEIEKNLAIYINSYLLPYHKYKLEALGHHIACRFPEAIQTWNKLETYLYANPDFASDTRFADIAVNKMDCYMKLTDHEAAWQYAAVSEQYFWPGSSNWYIFMEYYFQLAMHAGEYKKASAIMVSVVHGKHQENIRSSSREKWEIFKAYNNYTSGIPGNGDTFDIENFTKDFPIYHQDKKGYNISILIIQWCFLIRIGAYGKLYDIAEALKKYQLRYLKGSTDYRTDLFVGMMLTANRLQYNYEAVYKETRETINELKSLPFTYNGSLDGLEVIPFDILLEMPLADMKIRN